MKFVGAFVLICAGAWLYSRWATGGAWAWLIPSVVCLALGGLLALSS